MAWADLFPGIVIHLWLETGRLGLELDDRAADRVCEAV